MAVTPAGGSPDDRTRAARPDPTTVALDANDVLVLRALGLGDALTAVAALRGVRRAWPHRRLVLAGPESVGTWFTELGLVDAVLPAAGLEPLRATGPGGHVAVNLHGRGPRSHRLLAATGPAQIVAFACPEAELGAAAGPDPPRWLADEHEVLRWCRLVTAAGGPCGPADLHLSVGATTPTPGAAAPTAGSADPGRDTPAVLVHPGAAFRSRRWPAERWAAVARRLTAHGHDVVVTGSASEHDLCERVAAGAPGARSVAGELDLPALAAIVAGARLLLCGDTGLAHLATATGTASVLLFGPVSPSLWGPLTETDRHVVLWHGDGTGDPHGAELDPALDALTVDEVWQNAARLLSDRRLAVDS